MHALLVLTVSFILSSPTFAVTNDAKGDIYFTYSNYYNKTGLQIVYRIDKQYPNPSYGSNPKTLFTSSQSDSLAKAKELHEEKIDANEWVEMKWDAIGRYYFYDDPKVNITSGNYIKYAVEIYLYGYLLKYRDIYNYYIVPSDIEYCEIDSHAFYSDYKCSRVLDGEPENTTTPKERVTEQPPTYESRIGWVVVIPLVIVGVTIIVVICRRNGCCYRNSTSQGTSDDPSTSVEMSALQTTSNADHSSNQQEFSAASRQITANSNSLPPPYETAMANSTPDVAASLRTPPPSYVSVEWPNIA